MLDMRERKLLNEVKSVCKDYTQFGETILLAIVAVYFDIIFTLKFPCNK